MKLVINVDYAKLDSIVEKYIEENNYSVQLLPNLIDASRERFDETINDVKCKWSRKFEIDEAVKIVYSFLMTVDENLAVQFENIMRATDENNKPYVNIKYSTDDMPSRVSKGYVHVLFDESPYAVLTLLHEALHKMNEYKLLVDSREAESFTSMYFGETVSILGELLIGQYMVDNGLMTNDDFEQCKSIQNLYLMHSIRNVVIDNIMIQLKLQNQEITLENLLSFSSSYPRGSMEDIIINEEKERHRRVKCELQKNYLHMFISQKYIIAQVMCDEIMKKKNVYDTFVKLHYAVGDYRSQVEDVYNNIILGNGEKR